jgi:hypothetical protein
LMLFPLLASLSGKLLYILQNPGETLRLPEGLLGMPLQSPCSSLDTLSVTNSPLTTSESSIQQISVYTVQEVCQDQLWSSGPSQPGSE